MSQKDHFSRWYRGLMGGKSDLERQLEKELAEKRARHPRPKRKPLAAKWWLLIALGLIVWTALAFWTYEGPLPAL